MNQKLSTFSLDFPIGYVGEFIRHFRIQYGLILEDRGLFYRIATENGEMIPINKSDFYGRGMAPIPKLHDLLNFEINQEFEKSLQRDFLNFIITPS